MDILAEILLGATGFCVLCLVIAAAIERSFGPASQIFLVFILVFASAALIVVMINIIRMR